MSYNKRHRIVVNSYQHRTNDRLEQNWQRQNDWTTYNLTNDKRLLKCGNRRIETRQWDNDLTMTSPLNWPIRSKTRVNYHRLTRYNSLWLWRWLPHRLSKRQSLSTKVLFRTTLTRTIMLSLLIKWPLGSKLSRCYSSDGISERQFWVLLCGHPVFIRSILWS